MIARFLSLLAGLCLILAAAPYARADEAVEQGRQALDQWVGYPWYDAKQDDVRRIELPVAKKSSRSSSSSSSSSSPEAGNLFRLFGWVAIAIILAVVAWLMIRVFLDRETSLARATTVAKSDRGVTEVDRVTALPFQVARTESDLLTTARRFYDEGNFSQAIIYFYSYQLVELDKAQCIRLARGKTNRQYLRETRSHSRLAELLQQTMSLFEATFFGHHPIARAQFEACWSRRAEFDQLLPRVVA